MEKTDLMRRLTKDGTRTFITRNKICEAVDKDRRTIAPLLDGLDKFRIPPENKEISYYIPDVVKRLEGCRV